MTPFNKFKKDWQGKRVLIMGLGLHGGGVQIAKFFSSLNCHLTVTDLKDKKTLKSSADKLKNLNIKFTLGKHLDQDFVNQDLIIRNPSVPKSSKYLKLAKQNNIPIKMEVSLFAKYTNSPIIGITGTRGKTTTATLIYQILKSAQKDVVLAGNIPQSSTLPLLKTISTNTLVVLELSSWQLQGFALEKISPHISLVTNIYPDHLNRYLSMAKYIEDKINITRFQTNSDFLLLNKQNPALDKFVNKSPAKLIWYQYSDLPSTAKLNIPGSHNLENAAAALAVSKLLNINQQTAIKTISAFKGVHSRLQTIATFKGHTIINDTTSTTPIATIKALMAIKSSKKPILLLLGGQSKNLPLKDLIKAVNQHADQVVLLNGSGTQEIKPFLDPKLIIGEFKDQNQAVKLALKKAKQSATILFSPGFTSFDMFNNEFERGKAFNQSVKSLINDQT